MMNAQLTLFFEISNVGNGLLAAAITEEKPDLFAGRLSILPGQTYLDVANRFSAVEFPADLAAYGFPAGLPAMEALLDYRVATQWFRFRVSIAPDWSYSFGKTVFFVRQICGTIEKEREETHFAIEGMFGLGGMSARMSLALSNGAAHTILKAAVEAQTALPDVIEAVAGEDAYNGLPIPAGYQKPWWAFGLEMELDLTAGSLALSGWLKGNAALTFRYNRAENAYFVAAALRDFQFSDITPALEGLDAFLSLRSVDAAAVLSSHTLSIEEIGEIGVIPAGTSVTRGLTFFISACFDGLYLENILELPERCVLYGTIPQDETAELTLGGEVSGLTFLNFLELYDVRFLIKKQSALSFTVSGGIRLTLGKTVLDFQDTCLTVTEDLVSLKTTVFLQIGNPLGIPGITIEKLGFKASADFEQGVKTSSAWFFDGNATVGDVALYAQVLFSGTSPEVVRIAIGIDQPLRISGMISSLLGISWPNLLDIALYDGKIWYSRNNVIIGGFNYHSGLHAEVRTKIFFLPELILGVDMNGGALMASAAFAAPIDLYFIKFTGPKGAGPSVGICVNGKQSRFYLRTAVKILDYDVASVEISVGKSAMNGQLTFPNTRFLPRTVSFVWDSKGGFHLSENPLSGFGRQKIEIPNFKIGVGSCEAFFKKFFKFDTTFKVKAAISFQSGNSGALLTVLFAVTIQLETVATAFSGATVDLTFSNLPLEIHPASMELTFENLMETVALSAVSSIQNLFGEIVSGQVFAPKEEGGIVDLEEMAKFLSVAGLQWGTREIAAFLICRGLKKAVAEAFTGAVTSVLVVYFVYEGIKYLFGGMAGVQDDDGNYTPEGPAPQPDPNPENNPEVPGAPRLSFSGGIFYASWERVGGAEKYQLSLRRADPTTGESILLVTPTRSETTYSAAGGDDILCGISFGYRYLAQVVAMNSTGSNTGVNSELYVLARPSGVSLYFYCEGNRLVASWNGDPNSGTYTLTLRGSSGEEKEVTCLTQSQAVVENLDWAGEITVFVHGVAPAVEGPHSLPASMTLHHFAAPGILGSMNYPEMVLIAWEAAGETGKVKAAVFDESGQPVTIQARFGEGSLMLAGDLSPDRRYTVRLQAIADRVEGPWSQPHSFLRQILGEPENLKVTVGESGLILLHCTYQGKPYDDAYFPDNPPIQWRDAYAIEWESGKNTARMRLRKENAAGHWCAPVSLSPIGTPRNFVVSYRDGVVRCVWSPLEEMAAYVLRVVGPDRDMSIEVSGGTCDIDAGAYRADTRYEFYLCAEDPADRRRCGESAYDYIWTV